MLGFLVKTFPKVSETFVLQEILALQDEAYDMAIFSLQNPTDDKFHHAFNSVKVEVNYLTPEFWRRWQSIKIHLRLITQQFCTYWNTLYLSLIKNDDASLEQFFQAVYLTGLIQKQGIQHLHVHFASEPAGLAELASRLCGITYSISAHAKDIYLQNPACLTRKISNAQFVVTCTEYNRQYLQSINTSKTPVYRVYHGIDAARINSENNQKITPLRFDRLHILSVGRLQEKKGFPTLITACQLLKKAGYSFQCDIVGYGPYMETLQAFIEQHQLKDLVRLWGKLTHDQVVALYRQADIFTLPCQITDDGDRDGIPNVLMEAMTFAIPVISTKVSGIPEIIENNKTGLLIEAKNHHALFAALQRLIDEPELRKQLGKAGRHKVTTQFSSDQHIVQLKTLLSKALQNRGDINLLEPITGEQHG